MFLCESRKSLQVTRVKTLEKVVCTSDSVNIFGKGLRPTIPSSSYRQTGLVITGTTLEEGKL